MELVKSFRKHLRPVRRIVEHVRIKLIEAPYRWKPAPVGSADWLIKTEVGYGGLDTDVTRRKVSPLDPRTPGELSFGGMTGGDRMVHNSYASTYARFLEPFLGVDRLTVAEFGILKGTGLAIWCDLFPNARVLGFDIDVSHYEGNQADLRRRGAFRRNSPEVFEYDQLVDGTGRLSKVLAGRTLDVVMDDGLHSIDSILTTWRSVRPHLSAPFAYFIEDYPNLLDKCGDDFLGFDCRSFGMMTVIRAGLA